MRGSVYRAIIFAMAAALWLAPYAWAQEHQHDHSAHAAPEAIPADTELAAAVDNHTGGQPCGLGSRYGLCPMRDHSAMRGCCLRSCAHMPFMPDGATAFSAPEAALGEELAMTAPRLDPIPFSIAAGAFVSRGGQPHFHPPRA